MASGKTKNKKLQKCGNSVAEKNVEECCRCPFMGWRKKAKNSGKYTWSTPAFFATHHAAQREVQTCMLMMTFSKSKDQPGKIASPARGQLNRENEYFPFAPEKLVSRDRCVPGTRYHTWYQCSLSYCYNS